MESGAASTRDATPSPGPRIDLPGGETEPDPREATPWFQRLPPYAQEDARRAWREEDDHWESLAARELRDTKKDIAALALLFTLFGGLTFGVGWPGMLAAPCLGAEIGWTAARFELGNLSLLMISMVAWLLLVLVALLTQGSSPIVALLRLCSAFPLGAIAAFYGSRRAERFFE